MSCCVGAGGHQVLRIETKQAPRASKAEVVLSDGENTVNGDDAHQSTFSEEGSPTKDLSTEGSPKKDKKKKKGLRTPSFLKKKQKKKVAEFTEDSTDKNKKQLYLRHLRGRQERNNHP
ncbi:hypothetical protein B566_EDAN008525 [Ephemera danica]|nr:hypothetical protein B566_EDAN008525 [Ephemera danica]